MFPGETILSGGDSHEKDLRISEFGVLRSAAGHFVGTTFTHDGRDGCCEFPCEDFVEPNSRETGYLSKADAEAALDVYLVTGDLPHAR